MISLRGGPQQGPLGGEIMIYLIRIILGTSTKFNHLCLQTTTERKQQITTINP